MYQGGRGDADRRNGELIELPRAHHGAPAPPGPTRMMYDGTSQYWRMIPYLSAILGAREIEAWGRPPLKTRKIKLEYCLKPSSMMDYCVAISQHLLNNRSPNSSGARTLIPAVPERANDGLLFRQHFQETSD